MAKRKVGVTFHGSLFHGYAMEDHSRGMRQHRRHKSSHSAFRTMDATPANEERRTLNQHEARLIPGLGPLQYGFPNTIITKLKYCDTIVLTATLGAIAKNRFRANGIFDPDASGGGHQPMYRDQYAGIYDAYVVLGSKITVTWQGRTSLQGDIVGILGDNDATSSTTMSTLLEQNNSVHALIADPGGPLTTLSLTYDPLGVIGIDAKDDGSSYTLVGADPAEAFEFVVWGASTDGSSTTVMDVLVCIEYTVKFSQLSSPVQN